MADPQVKALLDELSASGRPSSMRLPLPEGRRNFTELFVSLSRTTQVHAVEDAVLPGPAGDIPARLYRPAPEGPLPVAVYCHGGGWVFGGLEACDGLCRSLAVASGALVVAPAYRLAPEHPYPAALEDCYAVTEWVHRHALELGADAGRSAVVGESSGGNLAAGVALLARDRGIPSIGFQLLMYPALDPSLASPSYRENAEDPFLSRAEMEWYWDRYLGRRGGRIEPYAAPVLAAALRGLPPAHVITAGHDVLRDEGELYAERLRGAGVAVSVRRYDDMVHGFMSMARYLDTAGRAVEDAGRVLAGALGAWAEA
ncbi:MAG TPA: alpha/beta hydrolase [Actinomycetes bacterium]|nr:alpha/beta hydrolase [Actinomycetes bacterium]